MNVRPHLNPLPRGEDFLLPRFWNYESASGKSRRRFFVEAANVSPSPWGEGRGEGGRFIKLIPLAEQRSLVAELATERALVEATRELAERFEQKLQTKLSEIWGAPPTEK